MYIQAVQASYVAKEWVEHALSKSKEEESHRIATTKAQVKAEKKYMESLFKLAKVERGRKSAEAALGVVERQTKKQHS